MNNDINEIDGYIFFWKDNIPPPKDDTGKYNKLIIANFRPGDNTSLEPISFTGLVAWDSSIKKYYLQYMKQNPITGLHEKGKKAFCSLQCSTIKANILEGLGIRVVRGILDEDKKQTFTPPASSTLMH